MDEVAPYRDSAESRTCFLFDGVCRDGALTQYVLSEMVEGFGANPDCATIFLPAQRLFTETHRQVSRRSQARANQIARAQSSETEYTRGLKSVGLFGLIRFYCAIY